MKKPKYLEIRVERLCYRIVAKRGSFAAYRKAVEIIGELLAPPPKKRKP